MKNFFLLFLFCFLAAFGFAQDYQDICSPGITFFKNTSGNILAFRQDSVYPRGNGDTIFISYRTIHLFQVNSCYDTTNGSILGREVYKQHDGTFYFFNWNHDTLTIKTQAMLHDTWKFCNLPSGSYIEAKVTDSTQDTILGHPDQVKVFTFQARDQNGDTLANFLNQKTIRLSRHYGLFRTFDLYFMPDVEANDPSVYVLSGKTASHSGIQNLTWKDIYNFDVGDEFHWTGYWSEGSNWQTIKRVLNKEVFGNYDSVRYTLEHCQITRFPMNPTYIVTVYDTIRETYYFDRMPDDSIIGLLPDALQRDNTTSGDACRFSRKVIFNERQTQESQYRLFHFDNTINPCWSNAMEGGTPVYDYSEGLGVTFYSFVLIDGQVDQRDETMVYYKKGNETWGTPVASGCKQLVPAEVLTKSYRPEIKIKPNPAETLAEITLEGFPPSGLSYSLTNDLGQSVLMLGIHSNPFSLNCAGLPAGLYVLGIMDGNGSILGMKRMIIK